MSVNEEGLGDALLQALERYSAPDRWQEYRQLQQFYSPMAISGEIIAVDPRNSATIFDAVAGAKALLPWDSAIFAGVRFPLNDEGLRFDWAPIIGIEKTFYNPFDHRELDLTNLPPRAIPPRNVDLASAGD